MREYEFKEERVDNLVFQSQGRDTIPVPFGYINKDIHSRVPRVSVMAYENALTKVFKGDIKYKTKKDRNQTILFEDYSAPAFF